MKSKTVIIIALAIVATVGIILLVSLFYKPAGKDLLTGTMSAEPSYSKEMMARNNLLRNEILKDTMKLRNIIQGLSYFGQFSEKVAMQIDTGLSSLKNHPLLSDSKYNSSFIALQDYSTFLHNNMANLKTTEEMLRQILAEKSKKDLYLDIESNLRDYGDFLSQVSAREPVLEQAALTIDNYLDKSVKKKLMQQEIKELKSFRDQMIADNVMTRAMLGEQTSLVKLTHYVDVLARSGN